MLYMVTFTINIPQMLAYTPYMDPMGYESYSTKKRSHIGGDPNAKQWLRSGDGLPKLFGRQTDQER